MPVLRDTPRHPRAEPADAADEEREPDPAEPQGAAESGPWQGESREYRDRSGESTSGAWYVLCQLYPCISIIRFWSFSFVNICSICGQA
jgi:hypothetical protein